MGHRSATTESPFVRFLLIGIAVLVLSLFLLLPLGAVFAEALRRGWEVFLASLHDEAALSAIKLTLLAAAISVPLNTLFGVSAAWLVTKYRFKGRAFLLSLIDLPFAVSPVITTANRSPTLNLPPTQVQSTSDAMSLTVSVTV